MPSIDPNYLLGRVEVAHSQSQYSILFESTEKQQQTLEDEDEGGQTPSVLFSTFTLSLSLFFKHLLPSLH